MKEHKGLSGIYKIQNLVNAKVYVGKTKCFYKRYYQYVSDVRQQAKDRINSYLLSSFLKYGFDAFEFSVLQFCTPEECAEAELAWMVKLESTNREKGYNLRMDSSTGMITHQDTSDKIRANLKQQWADGVRDGHSDKLKASWEHRDKEAQGAAFTQYLTKYEYVVTYPDGLQETMLYRELADKGYKNVVASFHRKKQDLVKYKDVVIERIKVENQE